MYFNDQNTQFPLLQTEPRKLYIPASGVWTNHITGTGTAIAYSSQNQEITKPQLIIGQGNMIIGELTTLSFHTFLLFKYPIRVKLTQNILREILDISLDY